MMTRQNRGKWIRNMKRFIAPLLLLYFAQLSMVFDISNKVVGLSDFLPNAVTRGGMALYILNAIQDLVMKWKDDHEK